MDYRMRMLDAIKHIVFYILPKETENLQHPSHFDIGRYGARFYVPKDESLGKGARRFNLKAKQANLISVFDLETLEDEQLFDLYTWTICRYSTWH